MADVRPTANYAELLATAAVETVQASIDALVTQAPELWAAVSADWPDERLTGRNYARVAELLLLPVVPFVAGPLTQAVIGTLAQQFPEHSDEIGQLSGFVEYAAIRLVGPLLSAVAGAGEAHAGIFRPMTSWDIPGFVEAVVKAPTYVVDGFLNGGYGDIGPLLGEGFSGDGKVVAPPGLLTPWGAEVTPRNIDGPIAVGSDIGGTALLKARTLDVRVVSEESAQVEAHAPVAGEVEASDAKPAVPRARVQQGINDFRAGIRQSIKRFAGATRDIDQAAEGDAERSVAGHASDNRRSGQRESKPRSSSARESGASNTGQDRKPRPARAAKAASAS